MKITILALCMAASSLVFGQTVTVADISLHSPISINGTVTFGDPINCSIIGHNNSSQRLIASAVKLEMTEPSGEPHEFIFERDQFFKGYVKPNSDFEISPDCVTGHEIDVPRVPTAPSASARVVFLQYEDGSVWGDDKVRKEMMGERLWVLDFLKSLQASYSAGGADGLSQALAEKSGMVRSGMLRSKLFGLRQIKELSGIGEVANEIHRNLATAELRKAALQP